jgi:hypothetical protein
MSLPGFTAETSLYKAKKHYQDAGSFPRLNKAIYPAQWWEDVESPRTYGIVLPGKEEVFDACIIGCRGAGRTYSACKRGCCRQVTGFDSCEIA